MLLIVGSPVAAGSEEAERTLTEFAATAKIDFWPALKLCGYAEAFGDRRAGVWLKIVDGDRAQARWDGACKAPLSHTLVDWPKDLPPGEYIVAATAETPGNSGFPRGNRRLRVEAVLPTAANGDPLYRALLNRICAGQGDAPTDKACRVSSAAGREER